MQTWEACGCQQTELSALCYATIVINVSLSASIALLHSGHADSQSLQLPLQRQHVLMDERRQTTLLLLAANCLSPLSAACPSVAAAGVGGGDRRTVCTLYMFVVLIPNGRRFAPVVLDIGDCCNCHCSRNLIA